MVSAFFLNLEREQSARSIHFLNLLSFLAFIAPAFVFQPTHAPFMPRSHPYPSSTFGPTIYSLSFFVFSSPFSLPRILSSFRACDADSYDGTCGNMKHIVWVRTIRS